MLKKMLKEIPGKMQWIGLTGGIATGKSTVAKMFKERGVPVIDADLISKQVVSLGSAGLKSVAEEFGVQLLDEGGNLDRKKMGGLVFRDQGALLKLEAILHPLIKAEVSRQRQMAELGGFKFAIYDVPLLFEKKLASEFDRIITVSCDLETQKARMRQRDGLSEVEIAARLASQLPLEDKVQQSHWVLNNNGDLKNLEIEFEKLFSSIQSENT